MQFKSGFQLSVNYKKGDSKTSILEPPFLHWIYVEENFYSQPKALAPSTAASLPFSVDMSNLACLPSPL